MNSVASVSAVASVLDTSKAAPAESDVTAEVTRPSAPSDAQTNDPAAIQSMSLTNPALESHFNTLSIYDPRGITEDTTPRGVDIDRVEMIKIGFEHIRSIIAEISENTAAEGADTQSLNIAI